MGFESLFLGTCKVLYVEWKVFELKALTDGRLVSDLPLCEEHAISVDRCHHVIGFHLKAVFDGRYLWLPAWT